MAKCLEQISIAQHCPARPQTYPTRLLSPPVEYSGLTGARLQVGGGGSNLSYGLRTLYAKLFQAFDCWLTGKAPPAASEDGAQEIKPAVVARREPELDEAEAAMILESLMNPAEEGKDPQVPLGPRKRKKSVLTDKPAKKVRPCCL